MAKNKSNYKKIIELLSKEIEREAELHEMHVSCHEAAEILLENITEEILNGKDA